MRRVSNKHCLLPFSSFLQELVDKGCLECVAAVVLERDSKLTVLAEVTAALAVMADDGKI